jgi:hypothetical protein
VQGWREAGIALGTASERPRSDAEASQFVEGMLVYHDAYGKGRITEVRGYGAMQTVKILFQSGGERSFRLSNAKITIVKRS